MSPVSSLVTLCSHKSRRCAVELYHVPHLWHPFYTSPMASSALQHWTASHTKEGCHWQAGGENRQTWQNNLTRTLRCLQKEMATYRHWSVSLWRDPDYVSHCRILSPDKTEWRLISATLCGWNRWTFRGGPIMVHDTHNYEKKKILPVCKFLPRDAMHKRGLCRHAVSVCVSSRSWIMWKWINVSSKFFHRRVAKPF